MSEWRKNLDPVLREYLDSLVSESSESKQAYSRAKNPSNAQIWVALSLLARENMELKNDNKSLKEMILTLNQKYKFLEKVLREVNPKKMSKDDVDPAKALKDVLKKM